MARNARCSYDWYGYGRHCAMRFGYVYSTRLYGCIPCGDYWVSCYINSRLLYTNWRIFTVGGNWTYCGYFVYV